MTMELRFKATRRWRKLQVLSAFLFWAGLIAHGQTPPAARSFDPQTCVAESRRRIQINMIPASVNSTQEWLWNNSHRTKMAAAGCAAVDGNVWSLNSADGGVTMALNQGLHTSVNLHHIDNHGAIVGYPEILYGFKPFGSILTSQPRELMLPMAVSNFPEVWASTNYSIRVSTPQLPVDFAYDLWITQKFKPNKTEKGDIELMIFLFHQNLKPAGKLLTKRSFTASLWRNGEPRKMFFDVYATDPNIKNHTSVLVSFALRDQEAAGALNGGLANAHLAINLQDMLRQMVSTLHGEFGWDIATLNAEYVNSLELGSEFTKVDASAELDWSLTDDCLVLPPSIRSSLAFPQWSDLTCKNR